MSNQSYNQDQKNIMEFPQAHSIPDTSLKSHRKKIRKGGGAENFKLGARFHDACLANWIGDNSHKDLILKWMKNPAHFLVMLGSPGTGKTYFCAALLNYLWDEGEEIYYITARHFFQKIQDQIKENKNQYHAVQNICDQEILIVDDIGSGTNTEWQQEMILELIDLRYSQNRPTIITSNLNFEEIKQKLGDRTHSRIRSKDNLKFEIWNKDRRYMKVE